MSSQPAGTRPTASNFWKNTTKVKTSQFSKILIPSVYFFGDKTFKGGNDYEIFEAERTKGNTVTSPDDTKTQCTKLFMS